MSLATPLGRMASQLAKKFGAQITVTYFSTAALDPSTGAVTNTETETVGRAVLEEYAERELGDGIEVGDVKFTVSAQDFAEPNPHDRITHGTVVYEVIDTEHVRLGTDNVLYEIQARR